MTLSALLISFLFASVIGLVFHVIVGGRGWRIIYYLILSWLGFYLGNLAGAALDWEWLNIGPIYTLPAGLISVATLFLGWWLGRVQNR